MITDFGKIITDDRVPPGEVWMYKDKSIEIDHNGKKVLRRPDAKIWNIGHEPSKLTWVIAPPG